jgi:mRNA-degrading endonuclease RelE of RelBE toxin-antitoxin system
MSLSSDKKRLTAHVKNAVVRHLWNLGDESQRGDYEVMHEGSNYIKVRIGENYFIIRVTHTTR